MPLNQIVFYFFANRLLNTNIFKTRSYFVISLNYKMSSMCKCHFTYDILADYAF